MESNMAGGDSEVSSFTTDDMKNDKKTSPLPDTSRNSVSEILQNDQRSYNNFKSRNFLAPEALIFENLHISWEKNTKSEYGDGLCYIEIRWLSSAELLKHVDDLKSQNERPLQMKWKRLISLLAMTGLACLRFALAPMIKG